MLHAKAVNKNTVSRQLYLPKTQAFRQKSSSLPVRCHRQPPIVVPISSVYNSTPAPNLRQTQSLTLGTQRCQRVRAPIGVELLRQTIPAGHFRHRLLDSIQPTLELDHSMEAGQPRVAKYPRYGDIRIEKATLDPMLHHFQLQVLPRRHG